MERVTTVIIGAGQCGLAMSRALSARGIDHVLVERGRVGESWRTGRWDSLRLLTPNRMNGPPGMPYGGGDPGGFMAVSELIGMFDQAAERCAAPVLTRTDVLAVRRAPGGYLVETTVKPLAAKSVVVATGACAAPKIPPFATELPAGVIQLTPLSYRRPELAPEGGVLVVGASASGLQIARELRLAGRRTILAVGSHLRLPRRYRGLDILDWMERVGVFDETWGEVEDLERVRRTPSLPLLGDPARVDLDLNALQRLGVEITGRLAAVIDGRAWFSGSLANHCAAADLKLGRLLDRIDGWVSDQRLPVAGPAARPQATRAPEAPRLSLGLSREGIGAVVWATGFRPDHSFLDLPVFDRKGRVRHDGGVVGQGLYVMGLPFLRTRRSVHIEGAEPDARALAAHLASHLRSRLAA